MKRFRWDTKYLYWGITAFLVIISCIVFFMGIERWSYIWSFIEKALSILSPIIWGFALAYLLNPMVKSFESRLLTPIFRRGIKKRIHLIPKLSRGLSIMLSIVLAGALIFALVSLVLPQLYSSVESIVMNMPNYLRHMRAWIENLFVDYPDIETLVVSMVGNVSSSFTGWITSNVLPQMNSLVTSLSSSLVVFLRGIINVFIGVIISCYVLFNKESFSANTKKTLHSVLPKGRVKGVLTAVDYINRAFIGFISGKILDSLIVGILCYLGCVLMKMPYPILISAVIGVTNIIPFFGPFIGAVPCALIVLMESPVKSLVFIVFILALQQVDGNIIGPKILGSSVGINGFWVMFAILVGGGMFGFVGMICGVPVFTVIYAGIKELINRRLKRRGFPTDVSYYKKQSVVREEDIRPPSKARAGDEIHSDRGENAQGRPGDPDVPPGEGQ